MPGAPSQPDAPTTPHNPRGVTIGLVVMAVFVALDQLTKQIAENVLERGQFVPLFGEHIGWELIYNPGGAWGFPAPSWIFLVVTVIVVVVVLRALPRTLSHLQAGAYGLLLSGAIGNVIDRIFRAGSSGFGSGEVVDFVAWGTFPRFNVADSAITVGFVLLVFTLWRDERAIERAPQGADGTSDGDRGDAAMHDGPDAVGPTDRSADSRPSTADTPTAEDNDIFDPPHGADDLTRDDDLDPRTDG